MSGAELAEMPETHGQIGRASLASLAEGHHREDAGSQWSAYSGPELAASTASGQHR